MESKQCTACKKTLLLDLFKMNKRISFKIVKIPHAKVVQCIVSITNEDQYVKNAAEGQYVNIIDEYQGAKNATAQAYVNITKLDVHVKSAILSAILLDVLEVEYGML